MKKRPPTIQVITKRSFNTCWLTIDCNAVTKPKPKNSIWSLHTWKCVRL
jgi:hypothetical protein